jgi:hypothetical protein
MSKIMVKLELMTKVRRRAQHNKATGRKSADSEPIFKIISFHTGENKIKQHEGNIFTNGNANRPKPLVNIM